MTSHIPDIPDIPHIPLGDKTVAIPAICLYLYHFRGVNELSLSIAALEVDMFFKLSDTYQSYKCHPFASFSGLKEGLCTSLPYFHFIDLERQNVLPQ